MTSMTDYYRVCPQVQVYHALPDAIAPYVVFTARPDFRSDVVNTDGCGFRWSYNPSGEIVDSASWWRCSKRGIVLGGSFGFSFGATHDRYTLVSLLNSLSDYSFLNLGSRGANSTQGLIAAIPFVSNSECVIVCSGINNLGANFQSIGRYDLFGSFYYEHVYESLSSYKLLDLAGLVENSTSKISSVSFLLKEMIRRVPLVFARHSQPDELLLEQDFSIDDEAVERAFNLQTRDLLMISKMIEKKTRLVFVTQPFADTMAKVLSPEEEMLFAISDSLQGQGWQTFKKQISAVWPQYVLRLQSFCQYQGIQFFDLNSIQLNGWCFVDRTHMIDNGYSQVAEKIAKSLS